MKFKGGLILITLFALVSFIPADKKIIVDHKQANMAFVCLNKVRQNPELYYRELSFPKALHVTKTALVWNDKLAKVAEWKASDMAKNNYFAHVDGKGYGMDYYINKAGYTVNPVLLKDKTSNSFESIYSESGYNIGLGNSVPGYEMAGTTAIKSLIIDSQSQTLGHRNHLLGIGNIYAAYKDIGIGFAIKYTSDSVSKGNSAITGSGYSIYVSVVIANHE